METLAVDTALLFNTKYLGVIPNDEAGRISFWSDIVKHREQLQNIRAIENFRDSDVSIEQGDSKRAIRVVEAITIVNAMAQLYMVTIVT